MSMIDRIVHRSLKRLLSPAAPPAPTREELARKLRQVIDAGETAALKCRLAVDAATERIAAHDRARVDLQREFCDASREWAASSDRTHSARKQLEDAIAEIPLPAIDLFKAEAEQRIEELRAERCAEYDHTLAGRSHLVVTRSNHDEVEAAIAGVHAVIREAEGLRFEPCSDEDLGLRVNVLRGRMPLPESVRFHATEEL